MSRPAPEIINEVELGNGAIWQVLAAENYYVITYKNRPINLRVVSYSLDGPVIKYKKLTYANLGNALAQVRTLNHRFKCKDFDVVQVLT